MRWLGCVVAHVGLVLIGTATHAHAEETLALRQWTVDGVEREALIHAPPSATSQPTPVVFAFHGHGGTMRNASRTFAYHTHWPEAITVYMQGLKTPGRLTDPEGKRSGWQHGAGEQEDRDLKFFDAVLASLRSDYRVDDKRIYSTGHSNGGGFTYLLWAARGEQFAAVAPCAAAAFKTLSQLKPKPVLHLAGEDDTLVKFAWQEMTINALRKLNECGDGQPWGDEKCCTLYPSKIDAPLVTYIHPGGHQFPPEAAPVIAKFLREQTKP